MRNVLESCNCLQLHRCPGELSCQKIASPSEKYEWKFIVTQLSSNASGCQLSCFPFGRGETGETLDLSGDS